MNAKLDAQTYGAIALGMILIPLVILACLYMPLTFICFMGAIFFFFMGGVNVTFPYAFEDTPNAPAFCLVAAAIMIVATVLSWNYSGANSLYSLLGFGS